MKNSIKEIFDINNGVAHTEVLLKHGINHYKIKYLIEHNLIIKIKYGVYKWKAHEINEWEDITHIVPCGVLCLFSAFLYYDLTTFVSSSYHLLQSDKIQKDILQEAII